MFFKPLLKVKGYCKVSILKGSFLSLQQPIKTMELKNRISFHLIKYFESLDKNKN